MRAKCFFGRAPSTVQRTSPPSKSITVGSERRRSGRRPRVLVDVDLHELDRLGGRVELLERRLDRLARAAPGRPEVDDDRRAGLQHLGVEGLVGDGAHARTLARRRSSGTRHTASSMIRRLIFECPTVAVVEDDRHLDDPEAAALRAVGQSRSGRRSPSAVTASRSIASSTARRKHLKPPVGSLTPMPQPRRRVEGAAARDRAADQPPVADPAARRRSGSRARGRRRPRRRRSAAGRPPGRARSRSPSRGPARRPRRARGGSRRGTPGPRPSLRSRCSTETNGSSAASRSASSPGAVGRVVVDHEHAVALAQNALQRAEHRLEILALVVGGQADGGAHVGAYDRHHGGTAAERPARGAIRAARRPDGARRSRPLPHQRLSQGGREDPRDAVVGRAARARREGEGAAGDRQDDRGEDRRGGG